MSTLFVRHRFHALESDPRPVTFPPPGPYWVTGYGDDYAVVVAYLPPGVAVTTFWPEASNIDSEEVSEILFTERFQKPTWWNE